MKYTRFILCSAWSLAVAVSSAFGVDYSGNPHRFQGDVNVGYNSFVGNLSIKGRNTINPIFMIQNGGVSPVTTLMVVDKLGNVGLGTAAPSYTLDVLGTLRASGTAALGTGVTAAASNQVVVGIYNDTRTNDNGINHTEGVFIVGSGASSANRSNALRVLADGTVLVKPSGDLGMGTFQNGPTP